jgi:hypothetical protein
LGAVPSSWAGGNQMLQGAMTAARNSVVTQGVGVALGLQKKFDWRGVAVSAIGGGLNAALGAGSPITFTGFVGRFASNVLTGAVGAAIYGRKPNWGSIAAGAFGSALGDAVVGSIQRADANKQPAGAEFNWDDADMDGEAHVDRNAFTRDRQARAAAQDANTPDWARSKAPTAAESADDEPFDFRRESLRANARSADEEQKRSDFRRSEITAGNAAAKAKDLARQAAAASARNQSSSIADWDGGAGGGRGSIYPSSQARLSYAQSVAGRPLAGGPGRTVPYPELDVLGNPTGQSMDIPIPDSLLLPGENVKGSVFFGGAGMDGPYIKDMVRAFGKQGIALTPANRDLYSNGTIVDATAGVQATRFGQAPLIPLLSNVPQLNTNTQFNLLGYSYGSNVAAQVAVSYARGGTTVDNLVLIGSPIGGDYLKTLQSEPNIKNVIVMNLTERGDPISAGMSNASLVRGVPALVGQMPKSEGHFYYNASNDAAGQARRDALAELLYKKGLR